MTNWEIAERIYEDLNKKGAGLGNASIPIIVSTLETLKAKIFLQPDVIKSGCEHKSRWVGKAVIEYCGDCESVLQVDRQTVL